MLTVAAALLAGTVETENAVANGDTRTLSLIHEHTKESATVTFKRDGRYDKAALEQLNWLLRDWREAEATKMDPRLFDVVWEAQRSIGSTQPLRVVCGYRSPKTNGMLRRRSRGVAEHSQHMLGKAMDFFMTDASIDDIRAAGVRLQRGGVGWYPRSGSPFVHLDVGSVRAWPRMTHDQLARIFPDGKTVHVPADGKPFPRYEEARAEILARGGTVLGYTAVAANEEFDDGPSIKGFFAGLFGGNAPTSAPAAAPAKARGKATIAVASADPDDAIGARQALAYAAPNSTDTLRDAMLRREGRETPSAKGLLTAEKADQTPGERTARLAPLPPRRPAEFAAIAAAIAAPLPPGRAVQVAGIGNAGLANLALGNRPVTPAAFHLLPPEADARDHLRALFSAQAQGASEPARHDAPIRLAAIQPKPGETPEDIFTVDAVATRFTARSPGDDLAATHFSGSAIGLVPLRN
ncbi:DUF882 domain-containing protein [Methylobacterium sp. C25]|nr:DUF882 domain-containing protein [Methylobacterium sp. C25]MCE4222859.1 DUF882 domain-containing protein [Methylobacterium sp. C25]